MNVVLKAAAFAVKAHQGQYRKPENMKIPYIIHPANVVKILKDWGVEDQNMLAAAWLHDVVEDCGVHLLNIERDFNLDIANMVGYLTNPYCNVEGLGRDQKAKLGREYLADADDRAQLIKLADILQNAGDIHNISAKFAKIWANEKLLSLAVIREHAERKQEVREALEKLV